MQGRSLSKQHKPQQMAAYQEVVQAHVPTSISARRYPRDYQPNTGAPGSTQQKLTAPIKSLQAKHRNLEMQLAKLSAEVANQHQMNAEDATRKRYSKQSSEVGYQSHLDQRSGLSQPNNKARILCKDRSLSGNKRSVVKTQSAVNTNALKVTSPVRNQKVVISQGSSSKLERQKQINEIIGHLKKNSQGQVMVKLSNKGARTTSSQNYVGLGGTSSVHSVSTPISQIITQKSQASRAGNSATRQYYAAAAGGGNSQRPMTGGEDHSSVVLGNLGNVSNSASSRTRANFSNLHGKGGPNQIVQQNSSDTDLNQLVNLQGNTVAILGHQGADVDDQILEDFDSREGHSPHDNNKRVHGSISTLYQQNSSMGRSLNAPHPYNGSAIQPPQKQPQTKSVLSPDRNGSNNGQSRADAQYYRQQLNNYVNENSSLNELTMSNAGGNQFTQGNGANSNSEVVKGLELGILSLHSNLKTLEGKYIDLANYYKQELIQSSQDDPNETQKARPSSSSTNQKRIQATGKRANSRESGQSYLQKQVDLNKKTPRLEGRSFSKGSNGGIQNFEEYKDAGSKRGSSWRNYNQAQERSIIEEVKAQKAKLEDEMRNLIGLYTQICDEDVVGGGARNFVSRDSLNFDDQAKAQTVILNQILFKYQNQLLTQSEYQEQSFERCVEKTFDELFEELQEFFTAAISNPRHQAQRSTTGHGQKLPSLPLMDRLEKLSGDYDIQQEYSLSNLKETMFQIQHANDQFQLDLKKIGLDFQQIQKKLLDQERGVLFRLSETQELSLDSLVDSIDQVSAGLTIMGNRLSLNDQKIKILHENHGESVRYLREYRDNFKKISSEYQSLQQSTIVSQIGGNSQHMMGEISGDQMSINQSYSGSKQQAEITQLNQEIFNLRAQLADAKQHDLFDLNELRNKLDELNSENESLHSKVTTMNRELVSKNNQISQRESQNAELVGKLNRMPSIQVKNAQIFEDFWRQNCQTMVTLSQKFLHSMRRLQKVVHRKESNVQQEKADFEAAKKELESNLKEVKRQLENNPPSQHNNADTNQHANLHSQDQHCQSQTVRDEVPIAGGFSMRNNPAGATSARPMMPLSSQVMKPLDSASASEVTSVNRQSTEQSQVPHRQSEQMIAELRNENNTVNKKLQKERQNVQNLLNELKLSQENLQKFKLTFVPQENVAELESSVNQLQETIHGLERADQDYKKQVQELKMTVNDKQMNIYELTRIANEAQNQAKPDFSQFVAAVANQVKEITQGQAAWIQSVEKHLQNKELQVGQIVETVQVITQQLGEKNARLNSLLQTNSELKNAINGKNEQISSILAQRQEGEHATTQAQATLKSELERLKGELKVKRAGNTMMNALMRGIKLKLVGELEKRDQTITTQNAELQEYNQLVEEQEEHMQVLQAKIEKKKFKSVQTKTLVQQKDQELAQTRTFATQKDQELEQTKTLADQKGRELVQTKALVAQKEQELAQTQTLVDLKDQELEQSRTLTAQKDQELKNLKQRIGHGQQEQDKIVRSLLQERDQAIAQLQQETGVLQQRHETMLRQVKQENQELQSTIKVKQSGNIMMNALMRAFKQKLIDEKRRQDELIAQQKSEIQQVKNQVQTFNEQVKVLQAKVEKKKFKSGQTKQLIAKVQQDQQAIYGAKRQVEEDLAVKDSNLVTVEAERQAAHAKIEELQAELIQMQGEHDKEMKRMCQEYEALSHKKQTDDQRKLQQEHQRSLEDARQKATQQALELATLDQLEGAGNQATLYTVSQLRIEVQEQRSINEERDAQATEYNKKLTESNLLVSKLQNQLDATKQDAKVEHDALEHQLDSVRASLATLEERCRGLQAQSQDDKKLQVQTQDSLDEKTKAFESLTERVKTLMSQHDCYKVEAEQAQADLRQERDVAQAQLADFINQNKFEKESLEGKLQNQLNQTMAQLDAREDECGALHKQLSDLKEANQLQELETKELAKKLAVKEVAFEQAKESLHSSEQIIGENTSALESNRELIVQFKAELQKNVDQNKAKDDEIKSLRGKLDTMTADIALKTSQIVEHEDGLHTLNGEVQSKTEEVARALAQVDGFQVEIDRLTQENVTFRDQIATLKNEYETKAAELEDQLGNEQLKLKEKDDLISEADALLAEFNNEKHEVKAKFKHLMQLVKLRASGSDDSEEDDFDIAATSSYKGRDGEVNLNHCFSELEQIILDFKEIQESKIVDLMSEKEQLTGTIYEQKQDLEAMQISLSSLQEKMDSANAQVETNDEEARRQIDTAMRKISNYKDELEGKKTAISALQAQILTLSAALEEAKAAGVKLDASDSGMHDSYQTLQAENLQLLERLQKTESNLQKAREGEDVSEETKAQKITLSQEVAEKLDDIDSRMNEIKRDLHMAKSSCLKDLMAKFGDKLKAAQKTFAESELLVNAINSEKVTGWNNIVKECKTVTFNSKQFMLVELTDEKTFHLVDLEKVTETAVKYLNAFIDEYDDDEFLQDAIGQSLTEIEQEPEVEQLKALVTDLRQDRIELAVELESFRSGVKSDISQLGGGRLKDEEMKDDIEYLTGENKELHLKVKEVCLSKASLQVQLAEARKQLQVQREVQEDMSAIVDEANDDLDRVDASDIETARNIGLEDEIFPTVQEMHEESFRMPDMGTKDALSDQDSILEAVNQIDEDHSDGQEDQQSHRYKVALQRSESENVDLREKLEKIQLQLQEIESQKEIEDEDSGESLIPHIKVTLNQFLRNVPLIDRQNEDLLTVIFNMMKYTEREIQELRMARTNLKMPKGKPARASSKNVTGGHSQNSLSREEDGSIKPKRGLFGGMFGGKKKGDVNTSGNAGNSGSGAAMAPPNLKPVPRR